MRRVLMISYHYYPRNDSALQRVAGFYKYLPNFGWEPWVLCPRWTSNNCEVYDAGLEPLLAGSRMAGLVPYSRSSYRGRWGRFRYVLRMLRDPAALASRVSSVWLDCRLFRSPEELYFGSIRTLKRSLAHAKFDAIWATFPPAAPLAVAAWARKKYGIPWVADFRDIIDQLSMIMPARLRRRLQRREESILGSASQIITISPPLADVLRSRHGDRVGVITNGFDPDDFRSDLYGPSHQLRILYMGRLLGNLRNPRFLFEALEHMAQGGELRDGEVDLSFYGPTEDELRPLLRGLPRASVMVRVMPWVPHCESVRLQQQADILLQLAVNVEHGVLTGKLFEYLGARRPILCVPGDGNGLDAILKETQTGVSCNSPAEVVQQLRQWLAEWRRTHFVPYVGRPDRIARYSRQLLAQQLARVLDDTCQPA